WERFIASQMAAAVLDTVTVEIENSGHIFRTGGQSLKFNGYMVLYDNRDDLDDEHEDMVKLPKVSEGEVLDVADIDIKQHFTEPPSRYTEASLIKFLEENGIGRPSTYAPIISIIISRDYVRREGKLLVGTELGDITTSFMKKNFPEIVDYEFTASMESNLDAIENSETTIVDVIGDFYKNFASQLEKVSSEKPEKPALKLPLPESEYDCPKCGKKMVYKTGRFGKFLACPDYPGCKSTIAVDKEGKPVAHKPQQLVMADFKCELCGGDVVIRNGKYGTFYACKNYPTCKFTKQKYTDIGVACPRCGEALVARHAREKVVFYSCKSYPECDFSTWDRPLAEKCPDCGEMLYYRKTRRLVICKASGCGYKREEEMTEEF
ncbi:MAG: DNA topoisomerase I, partial [Ruminococcaceae bacterium]|nr:DNA topoisomerase I [Oscillospiraceae bacterium]